MKKKIEEIKIIVFFLIIIVLAVLLNIFSINKLMASNTLIKGLSVSTIGLIPLIIVSYGNYMRFRLGAGIPIVGLFFSLTIFPTFTLLVVSHLLAN